MVTLTNLCFRSLDSTFFNLVHRFEIRTNVTFIQAAEKRVNLSATREPWSSLDFELVVTTHATSDFTFRQVREFFSRFRVPWKVITDNLGSLTRPEISQL